MMTPKKEYLYPMTIKISSKICEKVYFLSLPKKVKEMLIKLEEISNIKFNPQYHNLPTNSLKKMFISHLPGITDMKMISSSSDDNKWLISFNEININLVVRILCVWIEAFYIDETELDRKRNNNDRVKQLAQDLCKTITVDVFEPVFFEDVVLFENGKAVDPMAYTLLPMKIVHSLTGKKLNFMDEDVELFYSNYNEVVTNPLTYTDKKGLDYYSYVVNFSVQTLPPRNEAYLNIDISIRRWISRNEEKKSYLPVAKNCYIKVGDYKLQSVVADYCSNAGEVTWKNGDYKCYNACYPQNNLPKFKDVYLNPETYISGKIKDIYIPFQYGFDGIKHNTDNGKPFKDLELLFELIKDNIECLNMMEKSKALKISGSNNPTVFFDERFLVKNRQMFEQALKNALFQHKLDIEIWYAEGQEDVRDALLKILKNHKGNLDIDIEVYKLEGLNRPLQVENKKAKVNLKGFELRVKEIQQRLQDAKGPTLSFVILEDKDSFREKDISVELLDPKKALRVGFARRGRITQFITPKRYREIEQTNRNEIEKYRTRIQAYENGERAKKPKALNKNYYVNTVIQHTILDGYRQLGILCDVSKNKDLAGKRVTGIHICNYKNTIYGTSIQPFPVLITCDFSKGCITAFCDLIDQVDIPYWKFVLGMSNLTSMTPIGANKSIKSSSTVLTRRISRIIAASEEHIVIMVADGTSRRLIKGIANTEISKAVNDKTHQVTKLYINDEINGTLNLVDADNISIVRLRVNNEVPDYYPSRSEKNINNYKSMTGVFQFEQVYYSLDDKASNEKDTMNGEHSKTDKDQRYSHRNLVEMYPLFISDINDEKINSVMKAIHDLREVAIQYETGKTILPLPLHLAKKAEEYII